MTIMYSSFFIIKLIQLEKTGSISKNLIALGNLKLIPLTKLNADQVFRGFYPFCCSILEFAFFLPKNVLNLKRNQRSNREISNLV